MVEELKCFYFLEQAVPDLKKGLPTHLAAAEGVSERVELLEWWKLPTHLAAAEGVSESVELLEWWKLPTHLAAAERVSESVELLEWKMHEEKLPY